MLCLGVRVGESIMITDDIEVVVLSYQGANVRLGIKAPKQIPVHRKVIWNRMQAEKVAK